jgi:hypothetical protein
MLHRNNLPTAVPHPQKGQCGATALPRWPSGRLRGVVEWLRNGTPETQGVGCCLCE